MKRFFFIVLSTHTIICNSQNWSELGTGINALNANDFIYSTCIDSLGNVYAAGAFKDYNNKNYVAKWNGTSWSELGTGTNSILQLNSSNTIMTLYIDKKGYLYAGGYFTDTISSGKGFYIAKWDGTLWSELGAGTNRLNTNSWIGNICSDLSGNIYASCFTSVYGEYYIAKWDGTIWSELGGAGSLNAFDPIFSLTTDTANNIYTAGKFTDYNGLTYVAKWNGISWSELGAGLNMYEINSINVINPSNIYISGLVKNINYIHGYNYTVNHWDGISWSTLGNNLGGDSFYLHPKTPLIIDKYGNIITVSGNITIPEVNYIVKWEDTTWVEIGTSKLNANNSIYTLVTDSSGNIYASGAFTNSNSKAYVAKYTNPYPINNSTNLSFINIDTSSFKVSCSKGNGMKRLIICGLAPLSVLPSDSMTYNASSIFKSGYRLGTNNWVVYNDTGSNVTVTGLDICTKYYISVFEYNFDSLHTWYLQTNYLQGFDSTKFHSSLQIISSTSDSGFCTGSTFSIHATYYTDVNYQWKKDSTAISGATSFIDSTLLSSGVYSAFISKNNCSMNSTSLNITINPKPTLGFTINNAAQCLTENNFIFNDTSSILSGTLNRLWFLGDTTTSVISNPNKNFSSTGSYQIKLIVRSNKNCKDSVSKTVTVYSQPKSGFTINNTSQCLIGNSFLFDDTTSTTNTRFWNLGDGATNINDTFSKSYSNASLYNVKLKIADAHNCTDSIIKTVTVKPNPAKPIITAISKSLLQSSVANSYQWYLNNSAINGATSQQLHLTTNGNYAVTIDSTNGCGNTSDPFAANAVGIAQLSHSNEIHVFPNPAKDIITIENNNPEYEIEITDIAGRTIFYAVLTNQKNTIDIMNWKNGIYFYSIKVSDFTVKNKFIIMK